MADNPHEGRRSLSKPLLENVKAKRTSSANVECTRREKYRYPWKLRRAQTSPTVSCKDENKPDDGKILAPYALEHGSFSNLYKAILIVILYFAVGFLCFYFVKGGLSGKRTLDFVDAIYFSVVTLTTVGYGDLVPATDGAKLFTCVYMIVGFGLVSALISGAANYLVEKQEQVLLKAMHKDKMGGYNMHTQDFDVTAARWKVTVAGVSVAFLLIIGTLFLVFVEGMDPINAIYCVCVTVTTLGYGDITFATSSGRLFAAMWILCSTVCVAQFFLYVAEMMTEIRRKKLVHWVLTRKTTVSDLEAADIDDDGIVSAPEFVIYKLKELGKIEESDVLDILQEFHQLDFDRSGGISKSDLTLSSPS